MPPAATWLNPPDIAAQFSHGLQIGASIGQEEARLQTEHERTVMEAQARAETAKQQALQAQARIQTEAAYRTATLGLQQQRLQDAKAANDAKTKEAALKLADQQGFAADLRGGMKIEDALYRHPRLSTPASAVAAHKDALDLGSQRLDLRQQQIDLQSRALADREAKTSKPVPPNKVPVPIKDENGVVTGRMMLPESDPRAQAILRASGQPTPPEVSDPDYWNKVSRLRNTGSSGDVPPADAVPEEQSSEVPMTAAPSPFKEGQVVKNKKNGKTYKIVNGQPVEVK